MTSIFDRLAALSEPTRVRILRVLLREELTVGELVRVIGAPQPTVSRHLKQLDESGWVLRRKAGTASYYRFAHHELDESSRGLWASVAASLETDGEGGVWAEDARRLEGVLAARTGDSAELFRRLGGRWDAVRRELFGEAYLLPTLLALLPPGLVIADLGCGTGAMLPLLAPVAERVVGVDREEAMLEVARERCSALPNVSLRLGHLDALPLEDQSVDLAVCALVLHHVRELAPVFGELRRVLRPGGRAVVLDMVEHDRDDYRDTMGHQHLGLGESTLSGLAGSAGLRLGVYRALPADPDAAGPGLFIGVIEAPLPSRA